MATLQNFGVPSGSGGRTGMLQPKLKWKFVVNVYGFGPVSGGLALTQQVATVGRPTVQMSAKEVHSYNSIAYYAGKAEWEAIDLTVRDDVTNSVNSLVGYQLQKQQNFFEQTTPLAGSNYKFSMNIQTMDGGNSTVLEEWDLEGCFLASVAYDDFDYSSSEVMTIKMSIRYDNATQTGGLMPTAPTLAGGTLLT